MRRPRLLLAVVTLWTLSACSSAGMSCAGLQPIPNGAFTGEKLNDPVQARLSPAGFQFLNANYQQIVNILAPGQTLTVPVDCTVQSSTGLVIADMGSAGCTTESCGLMDGKCTSADVAAQVPVTITGLTLSPLPPSSVKATVQLQIATGKLYVDSTSRSHVACLFQSPVKCGMDFDSARATPTSNTVEAELELFIDAPFSQRLNVRLAQVNGLAACGTSGALPPPACTDSNDLLITPETGGCCPGGSSSLVKDALLSFLASQLKSQLQDALDSATCEPCGPGNSCLVEEDGGTGTCDVNRGVCVNAFVGRCVPARAGVEGRLDPAALLNPNTASSSQMDLSLLLGHSVSANTGLNFGSRGGTQAVQLAECVPVAAKPPPEVIPAVDFDAASDGGYHLALSVARPFLDRAGYDLQQSGALCASLDHTTVDLLNTGLLRPFLPSLGELLGANDVPMRIVVLPQNPPTFTIGAGTFDPATKAVIDPLLHMNAKDLRVDFYAELDDRYVRLFSALLDVSLPVSLLPDGCRTLTPVLGDLQSVVTNPRFTNSEIVGEDVSALAPFLPAVVSLAQPMIASNLTAFTLPDLGVFAIDVKDVKGVHPAATAGTYDSLAIYAGLIDASQCVTPPPPVPVSVELSGVETPSEDALARGEWPSVKFALRGSAAEEVAFRIDDGMWSLVARAGDSLSLTSPTLLLQGNHRIELRARRHGDRSFTALPAQFVTVDLQAPSVSLDRGGAMVVTHAYDSLSKPSALRFSYRVGDGEWTASGDARAFDAAAVEGGLRVRAIDESGKSA
ncbi:MAG: hypothetical protein ACJ790_13130, partial [Myxococcaceae bacterium]